MRRWRLQNPIIQEWSPKRVTLTCWRVKRDGSMERVTVEVETEVYHTYARWWRSLNDRLKENK